MSKGKKTRSSEWYSEWYERNKASLNERRRERYASDPEYREKVQQWNREARSRNRQDPEREQKVEHEAVKMQSVGEWKTVEVEVDGKMVRMFTIGALARAIGKGISTVRVWERNGTLPETPYRSPKGDRLYTVEMVSELQRALRKAGKLGQGGILKERRRPSCVVKSVQFQNGKTIEMRLYKVGVLARAISRTVVAITQMEQRGVLPKTPLGASSLEYRLYTVEMIEIVQKAFHRKGGVVRGESDWDDLHDEVLDGWTKLGVMDARVIE